MIKNEIVKQISTLLKGENLTLESISVEESSFGDYSTSFPLKLTKFKSYQTPIEVAKFFVSKLQKNTLFSEVTATEPGFINFKLNQKEAAKMLLEIIRQEKYYGKTSPNKNKKARVEFVSANPTGPLHIGNARGGPIGDSIASVLEKTGFQVQREYYNNDIGTQVDIFGDSLIALIKTKLGEKQEIVEEKTYQGEYLEELAEKIIKKLSLTSIETVQNKSEEIKALASVTLSEEIIVDCQAMGISFDEIIKESEFQSSGKTEKVVAKLKKKGLTKEKDSAVWFAPNDAYLKDRESVLVRGDGRATYFADDIAYHEEKFESKPDLVVNILGSNHHGHVPRLQAAIASLGFDANKFKPILYQYVRVRRGNEVVKMSKRAGNYVTAREVLDEVGKDAFRFLLLFNSANSHIDFDLELAKKHKADNPVYYVQYAHARLSSILKKAPPLDLDKFDPGLLTTAQEFSLIKKILEFPDLVFELSESFAIHQLAHYSISLAELFHHFYEKDKVISSNQELTHSRLALIRATKITLENSLSLLGVSAPESM